MFANQPVLSYHQYLPTELQSAFNKGTSEAITVQTDLIPSEFAACQTRFTENQASQTNPQELGIANSAIQQTQNVDIGKSSLRAFCRHWEPILSRQLIQNSQRQSVDWETWAERRNFIELQKTGKSEQPLVRYQLFPAQNGIITGEGGSTLKPVALAWSGFNLASRLLVAYGHHASSSSSELPDQFSMENSDFDSAWCTHRGYLCIWNLAVPKERVQAERCDLLIECQSCLTVIAVHPKRPALVAAGTYTGEILLWDLDRSDENKDVLVFSSKNNDSSSANYQSSSQRRAQADMVDPIIQLCWLNTSAGSSSFPLLSVDRDGLLCLWTFDHVHMQMNLMKRVHLNQLEQRHQLTLGGRGLSVMPEFTSMCVCGSMVIVGGSNGIIFGIDGFSGITNTNSAILSSKPMQFLSSLTPMKLPHFGPVVNMDTSYSDSLGDIFASCSTDGMVHVWSKDRILPLFSVQPTGLGQSIVNVQLQTTDKGHIQLFVLTNNSGQLLMYEKSTFKDFDVSPRETFLLPPMKTFRDYTTSNISQIQDFTELDQQHAYQNSMQNESLAVCSLAVGKTMIAVGDCHGRIVVYSK